jgi:hypothetical protein
MKMPAARRASLAVSAFAVLLGTGLALAQEPPPPPPQPVEIEGNVQFARLYEDVVLMPGERAEREIDVMGFERVGYLAQATADGVSSGRVTVVTAFGPPHVVVDNQLRLGFQRGTDARGSAVQPVLGPRLHVVAINQSGQKVTLNLSVYAAK